MTDKRCGGCNGRRAGLFFVLPPLQRTMPLRWIIILAVCGSSVALFMNVMLAWPLIRNWPGVTIWPYCISVRSPIYLQPPQAILHGLIDGVLARSRCSFNLCGIQLCEPPRRPWLVLGKLSPHDDKQHHWNC